MLRGKGRSHAHYHRQQGTRDAPQVTGGCRAVRVLCGYHHRLLQLRVAQEEGLDSCFEPWREVWVGCWGPQQSWELRDLCAL